MHCKWCALCGTHRSGVCVGGCVPSPSGGVLFCSATYRLFKVDPSEQCRDTDAVKEVQYKGRWERRGGEGRGEGGGWKGKKEGEQREFRRVMVRVPYRR